MASICLHCHNNNNNNNINNNNNKCFCVSGCEVLAKTEYISRHHKAAAYLHWNICQDHDIEVMDKWYEQKPESVTTNKDSKITIMWDMPVIILAELLQRTDQISSLKIQ